MATTFKIQDTGSLIGDRSRLEKYWSDKGFKKFYTSFRKGLTLPLEVQTVDSVDKLIKLFKLNEIGFGNWVTQEDRFNYICALNIALYDINKICKFPNSNVGLNGSISFSFGARGTGSALAHFEPWSFIINITRYHDNGFNKNNRFVYTGGAGSVAHEYGHALDYFFGLRFEPLKDIAALSGGRTVRTRWEIEPGTLRKEMNALLTAIIWETPYKKLSNYYERLEKNFEGDYMFRRNEIFARAFERYIQFKLAKIGIVNKFLSESKYDNRAYLNDAEMAKVLPLFDKLISSMANKL